MEDPIGFLRYPREEAGKQFSKARVRHWHEYEKLMPTGQAGVQALRCMDCGTPYCHQYCPVHNLIPEWNSLVSDADWRAAYEQLELTNNFPEFTGRICSAPCEDACTLSIGSSPVTIRSIELAIAERVLMSVQTTRLKRCAVAAMPWCWPVVRNSHAILEFPAGHWTGFTLRWTILSSRIAA